MATPVQSPPNKDLHKFFAITQVRDVVKGGKVVHLIDGISTAEEVDCDNEICDYGDTKPLYEKWAAHMSAITKAAGQEESLGNVRVQHTMEVGGKVVDMQFDDTAKRICITTEPIDDRMWTKIKKGFYTGYSQGGAFVYRKCNKCGADCGPPGEFLCPTCGVDVTVRYACIPAEVSYVDRPCLPSATFTHIKADGSCEVLKFAKPKPAKEVIHKERKTKRVAGEDLSASAFAYVGDPQDTGTWKLPIKFSTNEKTKSHIRNALSRFSQTQGIPDSERPKVHARIVAAARRHGIEVTPKKAEDNMELEKSLYHIGWVADILSTIRNLRDSNRNEAEYEEDDRDAAIADELDEVLSTMIGIGRNIYDEETSELAAKMSTAAVIKGAITMDQDLLKAARKGLAHHFTKAAAHHNAMAEHHKGLHEEHLAAAETHKGVMEDEECKAMHPHHKALHAHHKAIAAHHLKMHKAHAAHAAHHEAMAKAFPEEVEAKAAPTPEITKTAAPEITKAASAPATPATPAQTAPAATETKPTSGEGMELQNIIDGMVEKALTDAIGRVQESAEVKTKIDEAVAKALMGRLGDKIVPTTVKAAGLQLVSRTDEPAAQPTGPVDVSGVPLELADMCGAEMLLD